MSIFFRNDGKNFGFFNDNQLRPDDSTFIDQYNVSSNKKHNAEAIDAAVKIYKIRQEYDTLEYNCIIVKNEILILAEKIAKERNIRFILN